MVSALYNYCLMIDSLYNQQKTFKEYSSSWNILEEKIIELECNTINELVQLNKTDIVFLIEQLPILSMICIHLYVLIQNKKYLNRLVTLNKQSVSLIKEAYKLWELAKTK